MVSECDPRVENPLWIKLYQPTQFGTTAVWAHPFDNDKVYGQYWEIFENEGVWSFCFAGILTVAVFACKYLARGSPADQVQYVSGLTKQELWPKTLGTETKTRPVVSPLHP